MKLVSILSLTALMTALIRAIPTEMSAHMNPNVHPCDDFFEYTCGNWIKTHDLDPASSQLVLSRTTLLEHAGDVIQDIIKENPPLVAELWDSCMAIDKINAIGNRPLQKDLQRIAHAPSRTVLFELIGELARTGANIILSFEVLPDRKAPKIYTLATSPVDLVLPSVKYYSDVKFPTIEKEYREYITKVLELSGYHGANPTAVDNVIQTELAIGKIHKQMTYKVRIDVPSHEAISKWPKIFGAYTRGLGIEIKKPKGWFSKGDQVQVLSIMALDKLEKLFRSMSIEELKVFVAFKLIHSRISWLGDDFQNAYFSLFGRTIKGQEHPPSREYRCIQRQLDYLPQLIGAHFYKKTLDEKQEKRVQSMVNEIKEAMSQRISHLKWLDTPTRTKANEKLDQLFSLVGKSKVSKTYPSTLSRDDYAGNVRTIMLHDFETKKNKINKPVDREEWQLLSAASANAMYVDVENKIIVPAAMLHPPMFYKEVVHPARNYGAIGTIIGHELTHGFDNVGRMYDGNGNDYSWWTPVTEHEFQSRSKCFKNRYSSFVVHGERGEVLGMVKGDLTLAENIADNGGLSLAWDAYRQHMTKLKKGEKISNEEDQLFFISFGQSWCSKFRDETLRANLLRDPHSPYKWRVNGAVMNNDDFAEVFQCKQDAPMNPLKKCKIW